MIEIINLKKEYKNQLVLNIPYFCFQKGLSYLLVGENGSGKSTLIKLITGLIKPTSGDIIKHNIKISYAPEKVIFPDYIKCINYLNNLLSIRKQSFPNLNIYLEEWGLESSKYLNYFSKGMRQKLNLIQALITETDFYVFDEPLNGLDKNSQIKFIDEIIKYQTPLKTFIVATHYPEIYQTKFDKIITIREHNLYESN